MNNKERKSYLSALGAKSSKIFNNKFYFLLLVFSITIQLFRYFDYAIYPNVLQWNTQELTMSYRYGFIRRGLLGTFTYFLYDCFNIKFIDAVSIVQSLGMILFTVSFLLFFRQLLKNEKDTTFRFAALILISLNVWGFYFNYFGLLDTYIIFFTFLMVYLIVSGKALFLIPVLAGVCLLIHEGYPMMFFGIIMALLLYRFCYSEDKKERIRYGIIILTTGLVVGSLFIYSYILHPRIDNPDINGILNTCKDLLRVDYENEIETSNIRYIWLDDKIDTSTWHGQTNMWIDGKPTGWFYKLMTAIFLNALLLSPLFFMTVKFWVKTIKKEPEKLRKIILTLCSLMVFLSFPLIVIHLDQARWFYADVIFEIVVIGAISILNYNNERKTLSEITKLTLPRVLLVMFYYVFYWNTHLFTISSLFDSLTSWIQ